MAYIPFGWRKFRGLALMLKKLYYLKAFGYEFLQDTNKNFKNLTYDDLKEQISACQLCYLYKKRKNTPFPKDVKKVDLFIINSFISKEENESGRVLSSKNGLKLQDFLQKYLNLTVDDYYISYLYKCFCEGKNDELALKNCLPYMHSEIFLLKPKIILCLGENTFNSLGFSNFKALRGNAFIFLNTWFLTSFDMDFISKNPSLEQEFIDDLTKIKAFL